MKSEYEFWSHELPENWQLDDDDESQVLIDTLYEEVEAMFFRNYRKPRKIIIKKHGF